MKNNLFGVIDIGSNTIRLVLFKKSDWGLSEEQNLKIPARLRSYMTDDQTISAAGVDIIIDSLKKFQDITRSYQMETVDVAATAAVRQAANRDQIMHRVKQETDFSIRILSEKEEAYYGYLSVIHTTSVNNGYTVDMGGGSTEVTLIQDREMVEYHSFPFGALSLFNTFIKNEQPGQQELAELSKFLTEQFASIPWLTKRNIPLVGIGGSARNMALIHHRANEYPLSGIHHYEMTGTDIREIEERLLQLSLSERKKVDGLSKDRADIIIPATHALGQLATYVNASSFIMCRKGLREGVLYSHLSEKNAIDYQSNPKVEGIRSLIVKYGIDQQHTETVAQIAAEMAQLLEEAGLITIDAGFAELMKLAAKVFYLGEHLESESSSQHTFYILSNTSIEGMNHKDRVTLALLASFKSHSNFQSYVRPFAKWYSNDALSQLQLLGSILKLSYFLNITKRDIIKKIALQAEDELTFTFTCKDDPYFEGTKAKKHKKHLEKILNKTISFQFHHQ